MKTNAHQIKEKLKDRGMKVTPQRIAVLEAIFSLGNHPTADMILAFVRDRQPGISSATVYKVLDALVENGLIQRVKTEKDIMRYDGIMDNHHHLYCTDSEEIRDYMNEELDQLLNDFFRKHTIKGFQVEGIRLQITGKIQAPRRKH